MLFILPLDGEELKEEIQTLRKEHTSLQSGFVTTLWQSKSLFWKIIKNIEHNEFNRDSFASKPCKLF